MSGIVLLDVLRITSTSCACSASRCDAGNCAFVTATVKFPLGSLASCRAPPPHALRSSAANATATAPKLGLHPLTARATYHRPSRRCDGSDLAFVLPLP